MTCQTSVIAASLLGNTAVISSGWPLARRRGLPSASNTGTMRREPCGVAAAARELPFAGDAEARSVGDRASGRVRRSPRQQVALAENLAAGFGAECRREGRADRGLRHAPRGAGVGLGDFLDRLHELRGRHLAAAERARHQHAKQAGLMQRGDDLRRQLALALDPQRRRCDLRRQRLGAADAVGGETDVGGMRLGRRHRLLHRQPKPLDQLALELVVGEQSAPGIARRSGV